MHPLFRAGLFYTRIVPLAPQQLQLATKCLALRVGITKTHNPLMPQKNVLAPLALHQVVPVSAGGEVVIRLMGYDLDGDDLVATITAVPDSGTLHQARPQTSVLHSFTSK